MSKFLLIAVTLNTIDKVLISLYENLSQILV